MTRRVASLAALLAVGTVAVASRPGIPEVVGMVRVLEGAVQINLTPARYAISTGSTPALVSALDAAARSAGWVPEPGRRVLRVSAGALDLRAYRAGEMWLMQGSVGSSATLGVSLQAVFDGVPKWANEGGDAPGREPAGIPRIGGARRLLHLKGRGFEAACYAASAPPASLLAEATHRLRGIGWRVDPLGTSGLAAVRAGRPDMALWTRPDGLGAVFVVIATEEVR